MYDWKWQLCVPRTMQKSVSGFFFACGQNGMSFYYLRHFADHIFHTVLNIISCLKRCNSGAAEQLFFKLKSWMNVEFLQRLFDGSLTNCSLLQENLSVME